MKELQSEKNAFENAPGGLFSPWSISQVPPKPVRTGGAERLASTAVGSGIGEEASHLSLILLSRQDWISSTLSCLSVPLLIGSPVEAATGDGAMEDLWKADS